MGMINVFWKPKDLREFKITKQIIKYLMASIDQEHLKRPLKRSYFKKSVVRRLKDLSNNTVSEEIYKL